MATEQRHWDASARAWIDFVDSTDLNRDCVLDPAMLRLAGDVAGLHVLDVGCGEGRFCRLLSARGAHVTGLDPTAELIQSARERDPSGDYVEGRAESLPFEDGSFDLVVSYVALCDVDRYREAVRDMARVLVSGGRVLYANLGPCTSTTINGWLRDAEGKAVHLPVDNYSFEWGALVGWRGISIVNYHRPLCDYMGAFLESGLVLSRFEEPLPEAQAIKEHPKLAEYLRVRWFALMEWRKP